MCTKVRGYGLIGITLVLLVAACGEKQKAESADDSNRATTTLKADSSALSQDVDSMRSVERARVSIRLRDGSRILGDPIMDSVTIQTQYASFTLSYNLLRTIEIPEVGELATVSLVSGERLHGILVPPVMPIQSILGPLSIRLPDIVSIAVLQQNHLLDSGLAAFYSFHGDANDKSGHNKHGINNGARPCNDRFGNPDNASAFDGDDSYVTIPDGLIRRDASAFTLSMWISTPALEEDRMALYIGAAEGEASIQLKEKQIGLFVTLNGKMYAARARIDTDRWLHIVGVYRRGIACEVWVDGELKERTSIPAGNLLHGLASHISSIGSYAPAHFDHARAYGIHSWLGNLDDIRIFNRALEDAEINALFQSYE